MRLQPGGVWILRILLVKMYSEREHAKAFACLCYVHWEREVCVCCQLFMVACVHRASYDALTGHCDLAQSGLRICRPEHPLSRSLWQPWRHRSPLPSSCVHSTGHHHVNCGVPPDPASLLSGVHETTEYYPVHREHSAFLNRERPGCRPSKGDMLCLCVGRIHEEIAS